MDKRLNIFMDHDPQDIWAGMDRVGIREMRENDGLYITINYKTGPEEKVYYERAITKESDHIHITVMRFDLPSSDPNRKTEYDFVNPYRSSMTDPLTCFKRVWSFYSNRSSSMIPRLRFDGENFYECIFESEEARNRREHKE